jgi:DNA adenine methylase
MNGFKPITPFLRWAGSKRQILSELSTSWSDDFNRYLEPFLGSGSLFFYLRPKSAILGDINSELITTYEQVKNNLHEALSELSILSKNKKEYYRIRSLNTSKLTPSQRAARFIYLNRYSFNGLYRTNQKGEFNVPFGGERTGKLPGKELLEACSATLQNAEIIQGDFEQVLCLARTGDFVYLDPPYSVKAQRVFNEYSSKSFGQLDILRLRKWLDKLTELGVTFLLSYAVCEEAEGLMKGFSVNVISVRRNIAGFSGNRRKAGEWLITNKEVVTKQEG